MQQMVIANRLRDGAVVFLGADEKWYPAIEAGAVYEAEADAERALALAKRHESENLVVEPALIEVRIEDGRPQPVEVREAIRAFGPTVRTDHPGSGAQAIPAPGSGRS